jgi:hypothetical protein
LIGEPMRTSRLPTRRRRAAMVAQLVKDGAIVCSKCRGPLKGEESLLYQRLYFAADAEAVARSVLSASVEVKVRTRLDDLTDDAIGSKMAARVVELVQRAKSLYRELTWEWDD